MNTHMAKRWSAAAVLAAGSFWMCTAVGCATGDEADTVSSSGDPAADQRAEMRTSGGSDKKDGKVVARTLYERLGGEKGIAALVDDMTDRVVADPRVNFERRNVKTSWVGTKYHPWEPTAENTDLFKKHMVEFISLAAGGPTEYTGREMQAVHKGMRVSNNEFDAMVGDIKTSMEKLRYGKQEIKDLLAVIESTRKQIVEEK